MAEGVAAQTELTAGEAYLATAQDWTDLRRLAALVGYRPRPRIAAQGWVLALLDRGADPLVPAGTRVQAPATPARASQTFETLADTQLKAEWDGLTATWVPAPAVPDGRQLRFLGEPGLRTGDDVLFLDEAAPPPPNPSTTFNWIAFWYTLTWWYLASFPASSTTALSVASVTGSKAELGTSLVAFDRDLDAVLNSPTKSYAAYRILATAAPAKRLERILRLPANTSTASTLETLNFSSDVAIDSAGKFVVLDAMLEDLSAGQLVAVVDWSAKSCDVVRVTGHRPVTWEIAPGTKRRVSRLDFADTVPALKSGGGEKTIYVVDRRIVARHYVFPDTQPAGAVAAAPVPAARRDARSRCRRQRPRGPAHLVGVRVPRGLGAGELGGRRRRPDRADRRPGRGCARGGGAEGAGERKPRPDPPRRDHAREARQRRRGGRAPADDDARRADRLRRRRRRERRSRRCCCASTACSGTSCRASTPPATSRCSRSASSVDGAVTAEFGDGEQGARLVTGRNNVTATYRVGGGTAGEVESGAIDTLLGSVRGVKKVRGADPTVGAADQDDERRLRRLAPTRARAFGRAVSIEDLADLSLGYPGVSHAAAWRGAGPPGCACGGSGLHVAFIRTGSTGPRAPLTAEIQSLSAYLDARRDTTVALCVCAGTVATVSALTAVLAVDPRREPATVVAGGARRAARSRRVARRPHGGRSASRSTAPTSSPSSTRSRASSAWRASSSPEPPASSAASRRPARS